MCWPSTNSDLTASLIPESDRMVSRTMLMMEANRAASHTMLTMEADGAATHTMLRPEAHRTATHKPENEEEASQAIGRVSGVRSALTLESGEDVILARMARMALGVTS